MKKQIIVAGAFMLTAIAFGQKKEIKKAEKALDDKNTMEAVSYIKQAEALLDGADDALKAQFYVIKGDAYLADATVKDFAKMQEAAEAYKLVESLDSKGKYTKRAKDGIQNLRVKLVNSAVADQNAQNYESAAQKLYTSYTIKKDTSDLYYAAGNAVNAQDYATALKYYEELLDMGYTGIRTEYVAIDLETGKKVAFPSEADRNAEMLTGKYTNPSEEDAPSARGDILRNVTLIYISQGENEKALKVMKDARAENPDDLSLIRAEADMAYKMGDMAKYNSLMSEVVASDPNNPELYYNLGVGSAELGEKEKAMGYYKKVIELDPEYAPAHINTAVLILSKESELNEQMNALGTSKADYKKYDELKEVKTELYRSALPYLEKAVSLRPDNVEIVRTLMGIYSQLGQDDKFKAMKARLAEMEGGQ